MFSLGKTAIGQMFLSQNQDFDFSIKANRLSHVKFTMHSSASIFTLKKGHFSLNFLQLSVVWQPYLEVIRQVILQKLVNLFETLAAKVNGMFYAFLKKSDLLVNSTCKVIQSFLCAYVISNYYAQIRDCSFLVFLLQSFSLKYILIIPWTNLGSARFSSCRATMCILYPCWPYFYYSNH